MFNDKLKEAGRTMIAGGVAPRYVKRTIRELQDHFDDLKSEAVRNGMAQVEAAQEAEEKIGNLQDIAIEATRKKELKSWVSQHPRTTFLGGPFLGVLLTLTAWMAVMFTAVTLAGLPAYPLPSWLTALIQTTNFAYTYLAPAALAALCIYLSIDRIVSARLIASSLALTAVLISLVSVRANFPQIEGEQGELVASLSLLGFRIPFIPESGPAFSAGLFFHALFRILLAVGSAGVAWWYFKRNSWLSETNQ